jgi:hypothetical protein
MKIEDCQKVPEFFGVEPGDRIWIDGIEFVVKDNCLNGGGSTSYKQDGRALVGCLTGQLKWSTEPPKPELSEEEVAILRDTAKWLEGFSELKIDRHGDILTKIGGDRLYWPFGSKSGGYGQPFAYRVLVPILEKYGEIDLRKYREG